MEDPQSLLLTEIRRQNQLLEAQLTNQRDWKLALRNGVLAGLGSVLGATVVVSLLLWALRPFHRLEAIGPFLERLNESVEKRDNR